MLLLTLLLPPLIISLPQSLSKLSHLPSHLRSAFEHFRPTSPPIAPIDSTAPIEGIPEFIPEPIIDPITPEPLKPAYAPLIFAGRDAWRALSEDPAGAWETGDREHIWFFWFSGVEVDEEGSVGPPLIEGTEWPELVEGVNRELEVRRRKLETGMFSGDRNDEVYWDTAITISKHQQQVQFEQDQAAYASSVSSTSTGTKTSSVGSIFSSEPLVTPLSSYAHFAFVNCNDKEERPLCYRFLAVKEHRQMLFVVTRNTITVEPTPEPAKDAEAEVSPVVLEFVHTEKHDSGMAQQLGDDAVVHVEIEEQKAVNEDPVVEAVDAEPLQPTIIHKLILRRVPLKLNLSTTDLHNYYEFHHWEKLSAWEDVLNPADGLIGTAMEGKVGEIIGMGYEYWYRIPKRVIGMVLALLLLKWMTASIFEKGNERRDKKGKKGVTKLPEVAAAAAAEAAQIPLKAQAILPEMPEKLGITAMPSKPEISEVLAKLEIPMETQGPEEIEVVEHAELAKAEEVASIAEVLEQAEVEQVKPEMVDEVENEVKDEAEEKIEAKGEVNGETNGNVKDPMRGENLATRLEDKASMEEF